MAAFFCACVRLEPRGSLSQNNRCSGCFGLQEHKNIIKPEVCKHLAAQLGFYEIEFFYKKRSPLRSAKKRGRLYGGLFLCVREARK